MAHGITPGQIRRTNRIQIYHYIYNHPNTSAQEICRDLSLSRPTVVRFLDDLLAEGLIRHSGLSDLDQVGRKPNAFSADKKHRYAAGISLTKDSADVRILNLYGETAAAEKEDIPLPENGIDSSYYDAVCNLVINTLRSARIKEELLLGADFAVPCPVSPDGEKVILPHPEGFADLASRGFQSRLPFSCSLIRDAGAAAAAEMSASPETDSALYLSLSDHIGAALITDRRIFSGRYGHGSMVEHMQIRPGGRSCWCGKSGCFEAVLRADTLFDEGESPEDFFKKVRKGEEACENKWHQYLVRLSRPLEMLLTLYDTQIIIGGTIGEKLIDNDFDYLYDCLKDRLIYDIPRDYLCRSYAGEGAVPRGAALPLIWNFLEDPGAGEHND